ncbi:uncharacterized protein LOC100201638 [Hydra vulgaris]|uniref:uncharacterized protein LOC100201638 n=1 Tax=Hydra vulgaris TaxID=6087 RepID=UPI0001925268|nr:uncharacterized protein LOC100201638 [Hydra vulgaris]
MSERINCIVIDNSEECEKAFDWYVDNFHRKDDTALLVRVQGEPKKSIEKLVEGKAKRYNSAFKRLSRSEKALEKFKAKCESKNIKFSPYLTRKQNSIGQTICDVTQSHNVNVIVMAQKAVSKLSRTLLGSSSDSDYIMHHAQVPVLIIPTIDGKNS